MEEKPEAQRAKYLVQGPQQVSGKQPDSFALLF